MIKNQNVVESNDDKAVIVQKKITNDITIEWFELTLKCILDREIFQKRP